MAWRIEFERSAARELDKLDPQVTGRILRFLRDRVATLDDPRRLARPLKGSSEETLWRYRVGENRMIAVVEDANVRVLVVKVRPPPSGLRALGGRRRAHTATLSLPARVTCLGITLPVFGSSSQGLTTSRDGWRRAWS